MFSLPSAKGWFVPQLGHPTQVQRTTGFESSYFGRLERPLSGNRAAVPRVLQRLGWRGRSMFAASASGS